MAEKSNVFLENIISHDMIQSISHGLSKNGTVKILIWYGRKIKCSPRNYNGKLRYDTVLFATHRKTTLIMIVICINP